LTVLQADYVVRGRKLLPHRLSRWKRKTAAGHGPLTARSSSTGASSATGVVGLREKAAPVRAVEDRRQACLSP